MGRIESIEQQIQTLSPEELAQFRAWFLEFDWVAWDRQIEHDARAGKLDARFVACSTPATGNPSGSSNPIWTSTGPPR